MLHDIILSLSGHPSSLLGDSSPSARALSPPEAALLSSLGRLSELHQQLLDRTTIISSSHPSTICRAISSLIASKYLAQFQENIVSVEKNILRRDARAVGAYDIVPLSGVVESFGGWTRRMEWFGELTDAMAVAPSIKNVAIEYDPKLRCDTGAAAILKLRNEAQTGYPDIEDAARALVTVAETAWLRQLSSWILYGRLLGLGTHDFFIQQGSSQRHATPNSSDEYSLVSEFVPPFVDSSTANSILFIGRVINHMRASSTAPPGASSQMSSPSDTALIKDHLAHLSGFSSPISVSAFSSAIAAIRRSISQNTLQQLLPLPRILEILSVLSDFFLLGRGEFAVALITTADNRLQSRWKKATPSTGKTMDSLNAIFLKDSEVASVLSETWTVLASIYPEEDGDDDLLELARNALTLSPLKRAPGAPSGASKDSQKNELVLAEAHFNDLLLSQPTRLSLHISSPLDLFLSSADLEVYSSIHEYLLAIRRAHLRLAKLWTLSSLRRDHPSPLGPPLSNTPSGQKRAQARRLKTKLRGRTLKKVWATGSAAVFLLTEFGEYFQGEVARRAWIGFRTWLERPLRKSTQTGRGQNADSRDDIWTSSLARGIDEVSDTQSPAGPPRDPEALSHAHRRYLKALVSALLLTDHTFTSTLRTFLRHVDYLISHVMRLQQTWQTLDLEEEGVVDVFSNARSEENNLLLDLERVRAGVQVGIGDLIQRLRKLDSERAGAEDSNLDSIEEEGAFVPAKSGGVDRLLMKLDFGTFIESEPWEAETVEQDDRDEHL